MFDQTCGKSEKFNHNTPLILCRFFIKFSIIYTLSGWMLEQMEEVEAVEAVEKNGQDLEDEK